jgi:DNA polymerase-3 subunit gamma/tau
MLSKSAFNALLKTLEEPPEQVLFILATTESEKLPVTVRSRCQRFDLRRLSVKEVADYLAHVLKEEAVNAEEEALLTIARASEGSVRDALSLTERVLAYSNQHISVEDVRSALGMIGPEVVQKLSDVIAKGDAKQAVQVVRNAALQGGAPRALLQALSQQWHQLACMMVDESLVADIPSEQTQAWLRKAQLCYTAQGLDLRYQVLIHGLRDLGLMDEQRGVEMIVMRLCHLHGFLEHDTQPLPASDDAAKGKVDATTPQMIPRDIAKTETKAVDTKTHTPEVEAKEEVKPQVYSGWEAAVEAYSKVQPGLTALLEHVICIEYGKQGVRLALDSHQQRAIVPSERKAFQSWLGLDILWENKAEGGHVESISTVRARHAEEEKQQLWQQAEQDPAVQLLTQEMGARLVDVQMVKPDNDMENDG